MKSLFSVGVLFLAAMTLSACSGMREDLGLGRNAPDEFAVVDHAPLSMPPDFSLRPPSPGAPRPQDVTPIQDATQALFGVEAQAQKTSSSSSAETSLLTATHALNTDSHIRETVDHEASEKVVGSRHLVQELLNWHQDKPTAAVVDPVAEAARLKDAKEKGQAPNQTATPVIEHEEESWLNL